MGTGADSKGPITDATRLQAIRKELADALANGPHDVTPDLLEGAIAGLDRLARVEAALREVSPFLKHAEGCTFGRRLIPTLCPECNGTVTLNHDRSAVICQNDAAHGGYVQFFSVAETPKRPDCSCGLAEVQAALLSLVAADAPVGEK